MHNVLRPAVRGLAVAVLALTLSTAHGQVRLAVPSYQNPGSSVWNGWAAQGVGAVGIMIANLKNGDDTTYRSSYDNAIQKARKQGIYVLGYTYTGYGTRDPKIVRQRIDTLYQNYALDGIFFDEAPTDCGGANAYFPNQFLYYQELTNYVRQKSGAHLTVLNPGTYSADDCWMSIANILMNWENTSYEPYLNSYVEYPWVRQYPPDRFWHVLLGVPQAQLQTAMNLARQRNAGWVYISESQFDAYNKVPAYWAAEGTAVKQIAVQAPFATSTTGRVYFKWRAMGGSVWQTYIDTDQNSGTGFRGTSLAIGAEYMLESNGATDAHLYRYTGSGTDWGWVEVPANAQNTHPDPGLNLVSIDRASIEPSTALNYQIQALDQNYNSLYLSYVLPLSLNNTGFVVDVWGHP